MKGETLNLLRSCNSGVKASTFALASSSCSAAEHLRDCSLMKHKPGIRCGAPKTTSAVEVTVSDFGVLRMPSSTQGSHRIHDLMERTAQRRAFLSVLRKRSTKPFACGWYAVVAEMLIPCHKREVCQAAEVNSAPQSEVTVKGMPKREIQVPTNPSEPFSAVVSAIGTASGQRVVLSTIVNKYLKPGPERRGPRC